MSFSDFETFLRVSALIWVNLFFFVSSILSIYIWIAIAGAKRKVDDTLDTVQGVAFSIYEGFDKRSSQVAGIVGSFITGMFRARRKRK